MFEKKGFMGKIGNVVQKTTEINQKVMQNVTNRQVEKTSSDTQGHSMYEVFMPTLGMGKKYVFTYTSLIISNVEFLYEQIDELKMINPPSNFSDGVVQASIGGKAYTLGFNLGQTDRFMAAFDYACDKIDETHGIVRDYKYVLKSGIDIKIEIYDNYMIMYKLKTGITGRFSNAVNDGAYGNKMSFCDL